MRQASTSIEKGPIFEKDMTLYGITKPWDCCPCRRRKNEPY